MIIIHTTALYLGLRVEGNIYLLLDKHYRSQVENLETPPLKFPNRESNPDCSGDSTEP